MANFQQCNKCKLLYPSHYLRMVKARGNSTGQITNVRVCEACFNIIVAQQAKGEK